MHAAVEGRPSNTILDAREIGGRCDRTHPKYLFPSATRDLSFSRNKPLSPQTEHDATAHPQAAHTSNDTDFSIAISDPPVGPATKSNKQPLGFRVCPRGSRIRQPLKITTRCCLRHHGSTRAAEITFFRICRSLPASGLRHAPPSPSLASPPALVHLSNPLPYSLPRKRRNLGRLTTPSLSPPKLETTYTWFMKHRYFRCCPSVKLGGRYRTNPCATRLVRKKIGPRLDEMGE